jgi:hypothetical protein
MLNDIAILSSPERSPSVFKFINLGASAPEKFN